MVDKDISSQDEFPFAWIPTKDGSFTLKPIQEGSEWMHSLEGAYSESQYIYGEAIRSALDAYLQQNHARFPTEEEEFSGGLSVQQSEVSGQPLKFKAFSLGLGLGYVEWIMALECLKREVDFEIHTYELEDSLKRLFLQNVHSHESEAFAYLRPHLLKDYSWEEFALGLNVLKHNFSETNLGDESQAPVLILNGALDFHTVEQVKNPCHLILYDAYSSKSQNELWEEQMLSGFLKSFADENFCVFATYASTSTLKKALKNKGFELELKKGFARKRESILAFKKTI